MYKHTFLSFILHKKLISIITKFRKSYFLGYSGFLHQLSSKPQPLGLWEIAPSQFDNYYGQSVS